MYRSLPFECKDDPMRIYDQIIRGEIKIKREGHDQQTRDLLEKILQTEPNMRISLAQIKEHKFFATKDPTQFWREVCSRSGDRMHTPYKPNPLKYQYLLSNKYKVSSNTDAPSAVKTNPLYDFEDEMNQLEEMDQKLQQQQDKNVVSTALAKANRASPKKALNMLSNFAMQRVNKEFENF